MDLHTEQRPAPRDDVIGERECLVSRIVDQLRSRGYYLAHIDAHAGQALTDLRWAAQLAGRELGRRTRTYASAAGKRIPGMVTVIVAPTGTWPAAEAPGRDTARTVVEELLDVHSAVSATRLPA